MTTDECKAAVKRVHKRAYFCPRTKLVWSDRSAVCNPLGNGWEDAAKNLRLTRAYTIPAQPDGNQEERDV